MTIEQLVVSAVAGVGWGAFYFAFFLLWEFPKAELAPSSNKAPPGPTDTTSTQA